MVHQNGIKLAVLIVKEKFGSINEKVAESLLKSGSLTLDQVTTETGIELDTVRESLLTLTQHNIVQPFVEPGKDWEYVIIFSNILHIHRLPRFLEVVEKELPESCARIFSSIAKDGRCTLEQLAMEASQDSSDPLDAPAVSAALSTLANARLVERCPPVPFPLSFATEDDGKLAKSLRFCLPAADTDDKESVLWRPNYEEFMRRFRRKALIKYAKMKMGNSATSVLEAILLKTQNPDEPVKLADTVPLSRDDIAVALQKPGDALYVSRKWVSDRLRTLGCERRKDHIYSIDLNAIIEWARNQEVKSIIQERHGFDTKKVFQQLLTQDGTAHTSSGLARDLFLEMDDVRESLRTLLEEQYVVEQESPSRYMESKWQVNCNHMIWEAELERLYHFALNTKLTLAREIEKFEELAVCSNEEEHEIKKKSERGIKNCKRFFGNKLIRQDDALMLLHEF